MFQTPHAQGGNQTDHVSGLGRRGLIPLLVSMLLVLGLHSPAQAQPVCDVPLIVQAGTVIPNVLIILDSSGSMNTAIWHPDYDPTVDWSGNFSSTTVYYTASTQDYTPQSFNSSWPSSVSARLITSDFGQKARYDGNYLNWVFFHATDQQRAELPQITRMQAGRAAVNNVVRTAAGLRFGLMTFEGTTGGRLEASVGTPSVNIESISNSAVASGWTPTAETMLTAMDYFKNDPTWIQEECQQSFIVVVTDGHPTYDQNIPSFIGDQDGDGREPGDCASLGCNLTSVCKQCSDYMDDVAYYLANNDMRPDLDGDQHVYTYTIGFGINAPIIEDTAINGTGSYHVAWDLQTLSESLGVVLGEIVQRTSAGAAVAVVSTEQSAGGKLFRGKFLPGAWQGYFEAHSLPYEERNPLLWEAGSILKNRPASDRNIITSVGPWWDLTVVPFEASYIDEIYPHLDVEAQGIPQYVEDDGSGNGAINYVTQNTVTYGQDVINYVRGEDVPGFRNRGGWKLGDLVYSSPVVVGKPSYFYLDPGYQQYIVDHTGRDPVAYIGANDGMLHAFRAEDGKELWAYVPQAVLKNVKHLADPDYCHTSYVDLSPKAFDVFIQNRWRTVLIGGLRTGGDSYFCIDVTNPYQPELLWESPLPQITTSFTEADIIHTHYGSFLWTGSGPSTNGDATFGLFAMENGVPLGYGWYSYTPGVMNMASAPVGYDRDFDGFADLIYQGDLAGNLWRWDVSDPDYGWDETVLFNTGGKPIQGRPSLAHTESGDLMVFFGTGQYVNQMDVLNTDQQTFYGVRDDGSVYAWGQEPWRPSDLVNQTSSIYDANAAQGWYLDLVQRPGERTIEPPIVLDGVVYFTSFAPSTLPCSAGGESWLYAVNFEDGSSPGDDENGIPSGGTDGRSEYLGDGVASRAIINLAEQNLVVQTSDARLSVMDLATQIRPIIVRAWREMFDDSFNDPAAGGQTTQGP